MLALEPEIRPRAETYFCFIFNRQPAATKDLNCSLESQSWTPCNKFWLSHMRLKELNSKFSKTTGLETEADFRVWGHYIFGKAGIRSCNPLVRLSLGCKEGTRRNGRFGLPSRQAPSGNRHQCPFR